ncbi:MAG: hypothetical protein U1G07_03860 [Verrucomicrobiota bacterium]
MTRSRDIIFALVAILAGVCLSNRPVFGQVMLSPVAVLQTDLGAFGASTALENMINQSGLDTPFVSDVTSFDEYFANSLKVFADNGGTNNWQSNVSFDLPVKGDVDFDLGTSRQLAALAIWNVSIKEVTIKVRDTLTGPERLVGDYTLTNHINFPFSYTADILNFLPGVEGRFLRLSIRSTYTFSPTDTFGYAIIGEVILSVAPVSGPELTISRNDAGDVMVEFTGTLQAAPSPNAAFQDVPGAASPYTVPKASLGSQEFYRTRSN